MPPSSWQAPLRRLRSRVGQRLLLKLWAIGGETEQPVGKSDPAVRQDCLDGRAASAGKLTVDGPALLE